MVDEFTRLSKRLCVRLHNVGVERTPYQVMAYAVRTCKMLGIPPDYETVVRLVENALCEDHIFAITKDEI